MNEGPLVKGNPLRISVYALLFCYIIGEFILPNGIIFIENNKFSSGFKLPSE